MNNQMLDRELIIRTPEGVIFRQQLADPASRFLALAIDQGCIGISVSILSQILGLTSAINLDVAIAFQIIGYFVVTLFYFMGLEWFWRGQTIGKRTMKLRVTDAGGRKVEASQIIIRNLLRVVDMIPVLYGVGLITCLCSRRFQRLGDIAANTVVVKIIAKPIPDVSRLLGQNYNSLRKFPHLTAKLRQLTQVNQASLALTALLRRDELEPLARIEIFKEIAHYFRDLVPFPEEAVSTMSDEQYVRNVIDILYPGPITN
jgi:uncharacterized RDD family membrane protein YckC